jgi:phosphoribosylanthranilate isomerase
MMIKICGITRREDALAAAEAGASALGFIFYPKSPRYVTPEKAAQLADGIDAIKVGVFVDETQASIEAIMRSAKLDVAQIYGGRAPNLARVWRAIRVPVESMRILESVLELEEAAAPPSFEAVLLDGPGNGATFDWGVAKLIGEEQRTVIAGGLDASNVADAIRAAQPWGVDASSRLESSPGIKDHQKVRQFVRAAREA